MRIEFELVEPPVSPDSDEDFIMIREMARCFYGIYFRWPNKLEFRPETRYRLLRSAAHLNNIGFADVSMGEIKSICGIPFELNRAVEKDTIRLT